MKTIVEPKGSIEKLWGKQRSMNEEESYRMMRYVLRVDHEDKVFLHNVVTGQLVVLDPEEELLVDRLPLNYCSAMNQLIDHHFLVPAGFDEHQRVADLRKVLGKLDQAQQKPGITHYTILPTTACNARCYYCFEHGAKVMTMTEQIADSVVEFIDSHCAAERAVAVSWFGGEPTVAADRISQICEGLQRKGIQYRSDITSNGYLLDEKMAKKARALWHLDKASITLDGTEDTYNRIKAYIHACDSPYRKVLENVSCLLDQGIEVGLRMNFDVGNYREFDGLLQDLAKRFQANPLLQVHVHPVIGEYPEDNGAVLHGSDSWFDEKVAELNEKAREAGFLARSHELPSLRYKGCQANSDSSVTIIPDGSLVRCPEQFGEDQITGTIREGITRPEVVESWKQFVDYGKCDDCILFPYCLRLLNCSAKERCNFLKDSLLQYRYCIKHKLYS